MDGKRERERVREEIKEGTAGKGNGMGGRDQALDSMMIINIVQLEFGLLHIAFT